MTEPVGFDANLEPVFLKDIWPDNAEIQAAMKQAVDSRDFVSNYESIFRGDEKWNQIEDYYKRCLQMG